MKAYCIACRSNVRGGLTVHRTTARHECAVRPRVQRRSRVATLVRDGDRPSWMLAGNAWNAWASLPDEAYR